MKIVNVCFVGPMTDGFGYQENMLTKYQRKLGHEVTIIASTYIWNDKGEIAEISPGEYVNADGVKVVRLQSKGKLLGGRFRKFSGFYEALEAEKPDMIFSHDCQYVDINQIVKYAKKHNVRIRVDNHSDFSNSATNWVSKNILHKIIWRHYAGKFIPYTEKFYGVLPARVDFLKSVYDLPAEKCELLVMGADDELVDAAAKPEIKAKIRKKYGIAEDDFLVMTGGKIDTFKTRTLLLMEAVRNIDAPKVKLIVFGSVTPDLKDKVDALTDGKKVQYIGWVQSQDSYPLFAAADLVVFPGRHSVFWEQVAAQGIPMLCKKWDGTTHIDLGGNVEFLTDDSAEEIKTSIEKLSTFSDEYKHMKNVAAEKGMTTFAYSDIAKRSIE